MYTISKIKMALFGVFLVGICLSGCATRKKTASSLPTIQNERLYAFIDDWMGVPHRDGGNSKSGIDCSAFTMKLMQEVYGITTPRTAREMGKIVQRRYENQLKEGDLVFFSFGKKQIDHVGVYLANGEFVHVSSSRGVIISQLRDPWYYRYFTRCGPISRQKTNR